MSVQVKAALEKQFDPQDILDIVVEVVAGRTQERSNKSTAAGLG